MGIGHESACRGGARERSEMLWRDKLAVFLPAVVLAALLANPLPAEAHKVIIYDDVVEAPSPPPVDQVEVIPAKPTETVVWKAGYWKVKDGGVGLGGRPLRREAQRGGGLDSGA